MGIFDLQKKVNTTVTDSSFETYKKNFNSKKRELWENPINIPDIFMQTKRIYPVKSNAAQKIREMFDLVPKDFKMSNSFHNAEFPGGFALETSRIFPDVNWMISSWMPMEQSTAIKDNYGLYEKYPARFITQPVRKNPNENGDLTQKRECKRISDAVNKNTNGKGVDFYTSDGGIETVDYLNQESLTYPLKVGEAIVGLNVLKPGGIMILKFYTVFEKETRDLILHLCKFFKKVFIVKPATSRITNSEIYFMGINFISTTPSELSESMKNTIISNLYNMQMELGEFQLAIMKLFKIGQIPKYIINQLNKQWQKNYMV